MADGSDEINFSIFEDLQNVLGFDVTDDFESFLVDQEEVTDNSSIVKFTQVQRDELETVLERIATKSCNIPGEYEIASRLLDIVSSNGSEEKVQSFLLCVRQAFSAFYPFTTKEKTKRVIEIEQNFFRNASAERLQIEAQWDELVGPEITASVAHKHSRIVLEHVLLHFWSVKECKNSQEHFNIRSTKSKPDCSELEAIKYHAGWAVKRTRDIIKASAEASNPLLLKKSLRDDSEVLMDPQSAMALIALLGKDEQVGDASGAGSDTSRYNFIVADEVVPFFVLLHDFTEEYLSQSNLETHGDKIVIDCLKAMSVSCEIREAWEGICKRKFLIEVQVAVLQRVSTMFVKSKQSIIREKLDLITQKGSLSLRQDLKSKTSKKSTCTKSESEETKTPAAIKEWVKHFEDPEITV